MQGWVGWLVINSTCNVLFGYRKVFIRTSGNFWPICVLFQHFYLYFIAIIWLLGGILEATHTLGCWVQLITFEKKSFRLLFYDLLPPLVSLSLSLSLVLLLVQSFISTFRLLVQTNQSLKAHISTNFGHWLTFSCSLRVWMSKFKRAIKMQLCFLLLPCVCVCGTIRFACRKFIF